jgi:hypothetical protein
MPSTGGPERLLAKGGRRPRFSPDGKRVLYWTGPEGSSDAQNGEPNRIFTIAFEGGTPQPVCKNCVEALLPVWSPDGANILFAGRLDEHRRQSWWIVQADGENPMEVGLPRPFPGTRYAGFYGNVTAERWTADDTLWLVLFRGPRADAWKGRLMRDPWRFVPEAEPFFGARDRNSAVTELPDGSVLLASYAIQFPLWSVPLERFDERRGSPDLLTSLPEEALSPATSSDGQEVFFLYGTHSRMRVMRKNLLTGREAEVSGGTFNSQWVRPTAAGDVGILSMFEKSGSFILLSATGEQRKVITGVDRAWDLSLDGEHLMFRADRESDEIRLADTVRDRQSFLLRKEGVVLSGGKFSRDMRWVAFSALENGQSRLYVAPFLPPGPIPESKWIPASLTTGSSVAWSPDGTRLFFVSDEDGFRCIWSQALDPVTRRPVGNAHAIQHLHTTALSFKNHVRSLVDLTVSKDRIITSIPQIKGNIWRIR